MDNHQQLSHAAKRYRRDSFLIAIITIVGIVMAVVCASVTYYRTEKMNFIGIQLNQKYHEENELQHERDRQSTIRNQLMQAMLNMRVVRELGQKSCVNQQYAGLNPITYQEKLFTTMYHLVGAVYKTQDIFPNKQLQEKILQFETTVDPDHEKNNICLKDAMQDPQLRKMQDEINSAMLMSIANLENKQKSFRATTETKEQS